MSWRARARDEICLSECAPAVVDGTAQAAAALIASSAAWCGAARGPQNRRASAELARAVVAAARAQQAVSTAEIRIGPTWWGQALGSCLLASRHQEKRVSPQGRTG
ncbi:hypothetical protein GCM10010435_19140 [Winogradskya consettensis]|uniref:Uncharacterized protein n=1 Tax=Winogradskya consettensis TaxID=113560 RepID=A0A919STM8_9ACTN|nr:hypothetical protein Aco04nite_59910 [Actinoplanes consettensis]